MATARRCGTISAARDSNSVLKNHISHPHCEALERVAQSGQSSISRDGSIFVYNPDALREQFASLVIQRGLPFNHFDDEQTTRVFQNHLQPKYNHIAPHGLPGSYICVTAYWIEPGTWKMMKQIIAFEDFPVPHTGSALAKTLRNVFVNFNLENKIMSITLDNASNNTSAIGKLKLKYEPPMKGSRLNPRFNVNGVEFLIESISTDLEFFDDSYATKAKKSFIDSLEDFVIHLQTTEFATFDVLGFWKTKKTMFPVLSRMAMDILSVQATSVASQSAFSTSGRVLSIRRTRLTLASLEMYMCLKDHLDAQERKQDKSTLETPVDFEDEILDAEVQENKVIPLSNEEIALDAASSEGFMSGPGSEREEPEYDYDVYHDDY
ncbi:zinc finger BED domain-containing protein RICESLEEPER 2-like protein [Tanacetum coccineum]